jgi:hypothetical protein
MGENKMIKFLDILEITIQKKTKLGDEESAEGETYDLKFAPDKVIKKYTVTNPETKKDQYELMSKYPEFFVKIYNYSSKYVIMEKVQTPVPGLKELQDFTKNEAGIKWVRGGDTMTNVYSQNIIGGISEELKKGQDSKIYNHILKKAKQLKKTDLVILLTKIHNFLNKLYKTLPELKLHYLDIHGDNIGIDKQGNLKLFDINYDKNSLGQ